ncbi:MAG TPA: hypothetical protein VFD73_05345 [Gemmatimonadales bacterium]|nr:hypothetical protein [Gemmatimonadales bacterium]
MKNTTRVPHVALGYVIGCVAALLSVAAPAWAQRDSTIKPDSTKIRQLEAITVMAERPKSAAPPVTTIEVPATG